jgi:hypothetical protein
MGTAAPAGTTSTVSADEIVAAVDDLESADGKEHGLQVLDAFATPMIAWDASRFYTSGRKPSLCPGPDAKPGHLRARLQIAEQRTLRSPQFQAPALRTGNTGRRAVVKVRTATLLPWRCTYACVAKRHCSSCATWHATRKH